MFRIAKVVFGALAMSFVTANELSTQVSSGIVSNVAQPYAQPFVASPTQAFPLTFEDKIDRLAPITKRNTSEEVVAWLESYSNVLDHVALGALANVPKHFHVNINKFSSEIVDSQLINNKDVLSSIISTLPSLWKIAFWYFSSEEADKVFTHIFTRTVEKAKQKADAYDDIVNQTSLMIRFTKDNIFFIGKDDGEALSPRNQAYMNYLAQLVTTTSKLPGFSVNGRLLRAYMNSIPSKADGIDLTKPYPVFVDTSIYKTSDVVALKAFIWRKNN